MRYQLRLSHKRDQDLIMLHKYPYFPDTIIYRDAIIAFIHNRDYTIEIPDLSGFKCDYRPVKMSLTFPDEDKEINDFFERVKQKKNVMLLTIIRNKFSRPIIEHFFEDERPPIHKKTVNKDGVAFKDIKPDEKKEKEKISPASDTAKPVKIPVVEDNDATWDFGSELSEPEDNEDEFDLFKASMDLMDQLNKRHKG